MFHLVKKVTTSKGRTTHKVMEDKMDALFFNEQCKSTLHLIKSDLFNLKSLQRYA